MPTTTPKFQAGPAVSLNPKKRPSAGGIPDDESIMCATPPGETNTDQFTQMNPPMGEIQ